MQSYNYQQYGQKLKVRPQINPKIDFVKLLNGRPPIALLSAIIEPTLLACIAKSPLYSFNYNL